MLAAFQEMIMEIYPNFNVQKNETLVEVKGQAQQKMVKDSLERAFNELHAGKVRKDARKLFISPQSGATERDTE